MMSNFFFIAGAFALGSGITMLGVDLARKEPVEWPVVGMLATSVLTTIFGFLARLS